MVTFLMYIGGRSINVISLAGIAISVGLIMDASIISVDNILRLKSLKLPLKEAISTGVSVSGR